MITSYFSALISEGKCFFEINSSMDEIHLNIFNIWNQTDFIIQLTESGIEK